MCICVYMCVSVCIVCKQMQITNDLNPKYMLQTNYTEIIQEGGVTATWKPWEMWWEWKREKERLKALLSPSPPSSVWWADTLSHPCGSSWRAFLTTLPSDDWEQTTVTSCHQQQSFWPSTWVQHKLAKASLEPRKQWVKIIWRLKNSIGNMIHSPLKSQPYYTNPRGHRLCIKVYCEQMFTGHRNPEKRESQLNTLVH